MLLHEPLGSGLPVLSVKRANLEARQIDSVNTAQINDPSGRCNPWATEKTDATFFAEVMFGRHSAELVEAEIGLAGQNAQVQIISTVPDSAFHAANRAVAFNGSANIAVKLKSNATTVT